MNLRIIKSAKKYRVEKDALGLIEIPEKALWGSHTARALKNFPISGRTHPPALIRAYLRIKDAAAAANFECRNIPERKSALIRKAARGILETAESEWPAHFPVDIFGAGAGTDLNMNINEVIANVANAFLGKRPGMYSPIHPNDDVNRAQSTNDTFPTAVRLALLEASHPLLSALQSLADSFRAKGRAWISIPKAARTHLQDAVPMRIGEEILAYGIAIERCTRWLGEGREGLREIGIGGSAAGTAINVPKGYVPKIIAYLEKATGERLYASHHLYEAMQSQAAVSRYSALLKVTALEMTRICNDLRLLASGPLTGLGEILLPAAQAGSSIMPGKVNPSILEMCNQTWFAVLGHDQAVSYAAQAGQLELNVMVPLMAHSLLEASRIATRATLALRERCIDSMEPNRERLLRYFESTPQIATALSPKIGYEKTARLVHEAAGRGQTIIDLIRERKLLSEKELRSLLAPDRLTGRSAA